MQTNTAPRIPNKNSIPISGYFEVKFKNVCTAVLIDINNSITD